MMINNSMELLSNYIFIDNIDLNLLNPLIEKCNQITWNDGQYNRAEQPLKMGNAIKHHYEHSIYKADTDILKVVEPIIDLLKNMFPTRSVMRFEIAAIPPGAMLDWHKDMENGKPSFWHYSNRIHIPIITNDNAFQLWLGQSIHFEVGKIYELDNIKLHSAINNGNEFRTHLIVDMVEHISTLPIGFKSDSLKICCSIINFDTTHYNIKKTTPQTYINTVLSNLRFSIGRIHLMKIEANTEYQSELTSSRSIYLPLELSNKCRIVFDKINPIQLQTGKAYLCNTTQVLHKIVNLGKTPYQFLIANLTKNLYELQYEKQLINNK